MIKKPTTETQPPASEQLAQPINDPVNESQIPLAAMIIGIFSLVGFIPFLGIPAFVLGIIGLKKYPLVNKGFSITGIVTGAISTLLSIVAIVFLVLLVVFSASSESSWSDSYQYDGGQNGGYQRGMQDSAMNSI